MEWNREWRLSRWDWNLVVYTVHVNYFDHAMTYCTWYCEPRSTSFQRPTLKTRVKPGGVSACVSGCVHVCTLGVWLIIWSQSLSVVALVSRWRGHLLQGHWSHCSWPARHLNSFIAHPFDSCHICLQHCWKITKTTGVYQSSPTLPPSLPRSLSNPFQIPYSFLCPSPSTLISSLFTSFLFGEC